MAEAVKTIRCAIYTRKSTEDGLDQAFNSLDAQREACAAYILSQRHEGWVASDARYDDGGFSGGNMQRPGLVQLMADIEAGLIQTIVVYKIDRLTRSLADFAKIVDVLDATGASFVSITQSFNTTSSMGRLTLNVLLSFAQFEREVTGERIRDKIGASKKKGLWMGGPVPLGYEVHDRKLIVNDEEAALVRHIMQTYLDCGSVRAVIDQLAKEKRVTKVQNRTSGPHRGGIPFARGAVLQLLKNRIYIGMIVHKGVAHPGEHPAIVPKDLWNRVQQRLDENAARRGPGCGGDHPSLLIGLVRDGLGRKMSPSHAVKGSKRYRYLITHSDITAERPAWRVSAHDLEAIVIARLAKFLRDAAALDHAIGQALDAVDLQRVIAEGGETASALPAALPNDQQELLGRYIRWIRLHDDRVEIEIGLGALHPVLESLTHTITTTAMRIRRGHDVRLTVAAPEAPRKTDPRLIALLADAQRVRQIVLERPEQSISTTAADLGRCRGELADLIRLSFLAPDIVATIVEGRQPATLTRKLLAAIDLPMDWKAQCEMLAIK